MNQPTSYSMSYDQTTDTLTISFNRDVTTTGDIILQDAIAALNALPIRGGRILKINGAASLAIGIMLGATLGNRFACLLVRDPKLDNNTGTAWICAVSRGGDYRLGELVYSDSQ